jgi:hypothetical protein
MAVVLWWSVLLVLVAGGFAWLTRWAWRADLASAREHRLLGRLDRELVDLDLTPTAVPGGDRLGDGFGPGPLGDL